MNSPPLGSTCDATAPSEMVASSTSAPAVPDIAESTGTPAPPTEMPLSVASQTDAPGGAPTAIVPPAESGPKPVTPARSAFVKKGNKGADLRGTVALSVVASSHASLAEALKRLRTEFEAVRIGSETDPAACRRAVSNINSLLIESEAILRDLTSRSSDGTSNDPDGGDGRRRRQQPGGKKQKKANKGNGISNKVGNIAGIEHQGPRETGRRALMDIVAPGATSLESPSSRMRVARRPGLTAAVGGGGGILGESNMPRHLQGPPLLYQSPPSRVYRVDETIMQYRSPQFYSIMNGPIMGRFPAGPDPLVGGALSAGPGANRKPRSFGNKEPEKDFGTKKNKQVTKEKEEAAIRDGLRNATTICEFAELRERANKLGMLFEVAAVNTRVARLQKEMQQKEGAHEGGVITTV